MLLTGRSSELGLILQTIPVARGSVDFASYCHGSPTCNQMKFQLSSATGSAGSYRKETMVSLSYDPR